MRVKKVNRYYCDYCKKSGCSARWMKKHEERCTLNPNRYCGFCHLLDQKQSNLTELIALLPKPDNYKRIEQAVGFQWESYQGLTEAINKALPKLRELSGSCPACIMAALRQAKIPVPAASDFDFGKECESVWADFNESQSYADY